MKPAPAAAEVRFLTVDEDSAGQRLDNYLFRHLKGVPKTHVYRIIRSGEVRVNKGRAAADTRVSKGDVVRLPPVRLPPTTPGVRAGAGMQPVPGTVMLTRQVTGLPSASGRERVLPRPMKPLPQPTSSTRVLAGSSRAISSAMS